MTISISIAILVISFQLNSLNTLLPKYCFYLTFIILEKTTKDSLIK